MLWMNVFLGTKFLLENDCIWDFVKGTLIISGREVKLSERKSPVSVRRLYAADNVVIEKRSSVQIPTCSPLSCLQTQPCNLDA
jgi:hypothetical protein